MPTLSRSTFLDGRALTIVVVLGGLLTLQSSDSLSPIKVAYLLLAGASLVAAAVGVRWWLSGERASVSTLWLASAAAFFVLVVASAAVSRAHGTTPSNWLRDASAYALFGAAPVLGLALARSASRRWITAMIVLCGALAAMSFAVEWFGRRALIHLPIDRIALPSAGLAGALVALATALALCGVPRRWWWAALAGGILGLFFVTGTRATLLLLVVPFGLGLLAARPWRRGASIVLAEVAVAAVVFGIGALGLAWANGQPLLDLGHVLGDQSTSPQATPAPHGDLGVRVSDVGTLISNPGSDRSFQERLTQTKLAWDTFLTSPLVGVGPGYGFEWTDTSDLKHDEFTMDTPLIYLAKFGLVGLIPLMVFVVASLRLAFALWRTRQSNRSEFLAIAGFGLVLGVLGILVSPMEDKGVAFGAILLVGLGCRALSQGAQTPKGVLPGTTGGALEPSEVLQGGTPAQ